VVVADVGSEVAEPGLAGRPAVVEIDIGDGVVDVDAAADRVGVGEDVGGVAQQQLFAEARRDLIAIQGHVAGG
jgi:hypothetical protein